MPVARGVTSYTTPLTEGGNDGDQYYCEALNGLGNVQSAIATLTITADTNPPTIISITPSPLLNRLQIAYSEPVLPAFATNSDNYVFAAGGQTVLSVEMLDPKTVELITTPLTSNTNYTVNVSNVHDTSNLVIAHNSPASFRTPNLVVISRYDAGNTTDRPIGPPDPTTPDGGNWTLLLGTPDVDVTTNAVVDDLGTGLNAWNVTDFATTGGALLSYNITNTVAEHQSFRQNGWVLTVRGRFVDDQGYSVDQLTQYGDENNHRYLSWYDLDPNGALTVALQGLGTFGPLTPDFTGNSAYHLFQTVYNPATGDASYYVDGELVASGFAGDTSAYANNGVAWGAGSSGNLGSMNYNLVEFQAVKPAMTPTVAVSWNGPNIEVSYEGVLETADSVNGTYSALATNLTGAPVTYVVTPGSQQSQQYFRAALP